MRIKAYWQTLVGKALLKIALGITLIIALASGVSYQILFKEIERRAVDQLREYAVQRAKFHEAHFALAREFHQVIKQEFLRRYQEPSPDFERRFDQLMVRYPDGALRNRPEYADITRYSTGWIHKDVRPNPEFKRLWMLFFDLSEQFSRLTTTRFVNLYFLHPTESANMGYDDPARSNQVHWAADTPADWVLNQQDSFLMATPARNARRETVWAGPEYEPAYRQLLVPAVTPIDLNGEHIATVASDTLLDDLEASILRADIPGAAHTVFRDDGRLIIDRTYQPKIIEHEGIYFIQQTSDARLRALLALTTHAPVLPDYGYNPDADQYYAISRLQGPRWYFASTLPGSLIRSEAFKAAQWVLWAGFASLALVLAVLAMLLHRQIAVPLRQLLVAVRQMGQQRVLIPLDTTRRDEIGKLAAAFTIAAQSVADEIRQRDWNLQQESSGRMQAYQALQASETRYRVVAEQTGHIVYDYDLSSGRIDWAGPIPQITGYRFQEFAELNIDGWAERIHPDDRAQALQALRQARSEFRKYQVEYRFRRADGSYIYLEDEGVLLTDIKDRSRRMLGTMKDISERKRVEQALREAKEEADKANRAKSRFLADISHELRTPLNAILGYAQILLRDAGLAQKAHGGLTIIQQSGEHLLGLINDILDLAKIESNKLDVQSETFDLCDFVQGIAGAFAVRAKQKNLHFRTDADPGLPVHVRGDERKLRQILFNLIGNAIKFTDAGEIGFAITTDEGRIRFAVTDTGCGIRAEELSQLFQPFGRVGERSQATEGAGLGLIISRRLVELLGGVLSVESTFGQGSRFWFALALPAVAAPTRIETAPNAPVIGYRGPRRRVLIADDKRENRAVLVDMLAPLGFKVAEAANGQAALDLVGPFQPDAVLMDMRMPVLDGLEATRRLRQSEVARELVIIAVSASAYGHQRAQYLAAGADAFLSKPFRQDELLELLRLHLKLELVYADTTSRSVPSERPSAQTVLAPPETDLAILRDFAQRGDIKNLLVQLDRLERADTAYAPFTAHVRDLAERFQLKKINELLAGGDLTP
ncbi:putative Histidine kinase [Candidatus Competibacter denitrificans Run_A_D11]|uniref:histidine kinase n=2 Tax=Candidatus Competibacter TaxID=221279 RepID=W6M524_9GAMM|nr:putative Histidine kinase [Candidatus Competibacter denitrificans Run_A_D11]